MSGNPSFDGFKPALGVQQKTIWKLRLYVTNETPRCLAAYSKLKAICEHHLAGMYQIEVIDLFENPESSRGDQILAVPTLVRRFPGPARRVIGDLSNTERVLAGLALPAVANGP